MSSLRGNIDIVTGIFKQVVEQVEKDQQQLEEDRRKCEEEKQKWEEEKAKMKCMFVFHSQVIDLNVGGTHYSTSRSTLTKYPDSMLGVMFSGRHDIGAMKCSDGSFFIDRDGPRFGIILDYLRDGETVVKSIPESAEDVLGLYRDAEYYQLEGLVTALQPLVREVDEVCYQSVAVNFKPGSGTYDVDGNLPPRTGGNPTTITAKFQSTQAISYKHKSLKNLTFNAVRFDHPVSFINCNLSGTSFSGCSFGSDAIFEDCILDGTKFSDINGLVSNPHKVSFAGSKVDKIRFDYRDVRQQLESAGKMISIVPSAVSEY